MVSVLLAKPSLQLLCHTRTLDGCGVGVRRGALVNVLQQLCEAVDFRTDLTATTCLGFRV